MMYSSIIRNNMKDVLQKSADNYEPRGRLDPVGFERHVSFLTYLPPADLAPFIEQSTRSQLPAMAASNWFVQNLCTRLPTSSTSTGWVLPSPPMETIAKM